MRSNLEKSILIKMIILNKILRLFKSIDGEPAYFNSKRIQLISIYFNYFIFWINVAGILFLAINYQLLFDYFKQSVLVLITLVTSIALLLTGKKNLELKYGNFDQVFSSLKTWIPNIFILVIIIIITRGIIFPARQTLIVHINSKCLSKLEEPFKINGNAILYVKKNNSDSLIRRESFSDSLVIFNFEKPRNVGEYFIKIQLDNKLDRFHLKSDLFPEETDIPEHKDCFEPEIELIQKNYKVLAPSNIARIIFEDITGFGKAKLQSVKNDTSISIINGEYKYSLYDKFNNIVFSDIITVNKSSLESSIKLPKNSREVRIIIPEGKLELKGKGFLGKMNVQNGETITLLNNTDYEYFLNKNYYWTQSGRISLADVNADNSIIISLSESKRKIASVKFIAEMPNGEKVTADIYIDGNYVGNTEKLFQLKFNKYNNIKLSYIDSLTSKGDKFLYET